MSKKLRRISNIRIYSTYYIIFLLGGILFIVGLYMYYYGAEISGDPSLPDARGLEIAGFILIALGLVFIVLSYIYARTGARVVGTNCPLCHGTGYIDAGTRKDPRKEICSVCNGTGKMYDKGSKLWEEEKRKQAILKEKEKAQVEQKVNEISNNNVDT